MNEHISSAYDRDLEGITTLILKMGGLVEEAILQSAESLATRDVELAEKVRAAAPVSKDLRAILTVLRLAASLERIGDYSKNIAKRTSVVVEMTPITGADAALRRMAREVQSMFDSATKRSIRCTMRCFVNS